MNIATATLSAFQTLTTFRNPKIKHSLVYFDTQYIQRYND